MKGLLLCGLCAALLGCASAGPLKGSEGKAAPKSKWVLLYSPHDIGESYFLARTSVPNIPLIPIREIADPAVWDTHAVVTLNPKTDVTACGAPNPIFQKGDVLAVQTDPDTFNTTLYLSTAGNMASRNLIIERDANGKMLWARTSPSVTGPGEYDFYVMIADCSIASDKNILEKTYLVEAFLPRGQDLKCDDERPDSSLHNGPNNWQKRPSANGPCIFGEDGGSVGNEPRH